MKQNVLARFFILGLVIFVLCINNCTKAPELSDEEVVEQLLDHLNTRLPGTQFKVEPKTSIVNFVGKNRYQITFKNAYFTTDLAWIVNMIFKHLSSGDSPYTGLDTVLMEEVVIVYGPGEDYLSLRSIKGMSLEHEFSQSHQSNQSSGIGGFKMNKVRVSVGKITFNDLDINQLVKSGKKDSTKVVGGTASDTAQPAESTLEHLKLEVSGLTARKDLLSIILDIEKIGSVDEGKEDHNISAYMLDKDAPPPDLKDTLEKGLAINDLKIQLGKVNLLIKKNGIKEGDGIMDHASYSQFMKPDENRKSFQLGHGIEIKNFELSLANKKEVQLLSRVKEFQYGFSMKRLTPAVVQTFLDLTKKGFTSRDLVDSTKMTDFTSLAMKLWLEVMNSRPQIKFSISLKHYFGDLDVTAEIYLHHLLSGPILKVKVNIFKLDDILNKLKETNVLPDSILMELKQFIETQPVKKENGDVTITYEWNIQQLSKFFSNIKPGMINPMMIR